MIRTLSFLVICVLFVAYLASAQRRELEQRLTPQSQQQLLQQQQPRQLKQPQQQQRQSQQRKIDTVEQVQIPTLGILASRSDLQLPAVSDADLQRFLEDEAAVTAMTQCFITPKRCPGNQEFDIVKQVRGLGSGGACKACTKEEQDKLHQLIYEFINHFITRYPHLWRKVIPHLGNLITLASPKKT